jgi:hypothetical protein
MAQLEAKDRPREYFIQTECSSEESLRQRLEASGIKASSVKFMRVGLKWGFIGEYTLSELDPLFDLPFFQYVQHTRMAQGA